MSVESAVSYIKRMREDEEFRKALNEFHEDEAAAWAYAKEAGYDFTMNEFNQARDVIYKEHGITPDW